MTKKRIVSGITATGKLTIGNYIGAIKSMVELQDEYDMFIFVADLHALTVDISPEELENNRRDMLALYIACGIDPKKTTLFFQSDVPQHSQMAWIMENKTTMGELSRMTQFKDKSIKQGGGSGEKIKTGLFTYPALMAGDILLYNPSLVPVGIDQKQHLELTRNIASRFNNEYGDTFIVPDIYITKIGSKIMSLTDPSSKMSKSDKSQKSYIALLDDPENAMKKIKKAVTDSDNKILISDDKKGLKNLITIYSALSNIPMDSIVEKYQGDENYGRFKVDLSEIVEGFLKDLQIKYNAALSNIDTIRKEGAAKAKKIAEATLNDVMKKIGLST